MLSTLSLNANGTYSLLTPDMQTDTFNSPTSSSYPGALVSEKDTAGDTLTVSYGSPSPGSGQCPSAATSCNTVTSASGRALVIGLNGSGGAGEITSVADPMGRTWTYSYGSAGDLLTAKDPLGNVTTYSYAGTRSGPVLAHDIVAVTAPLYVASVPTSTQIATFCSGRARRRATPRSTATTPTGGWCAKPIR